MSDPEKPAMVSCVLNGCTEPQGTGTWCSVTEDRKPLPICEAHWQALRDVHVGRPAEPPRTPVCTECGGSIVFVPKSGFGNSGDWRHRSAPTTRIGHMARPKVFITGDGVPSQQREAAPDGFLGC